VIVMEILRSSTGLEAGSGSTARSAYAGLIRASRMWANGIVAGAGSDVPVTPMTPWWGVWAAVVRRELDDG